MVSITGNIFKFIFKRLNNINVCKDPNLIVKLGKLEKYFLKDKPRKGYTLTRQETKNHTKFIVVKKDSNQPAKKLILYIHGGVYISPLLYYYQTFSYPLCDIREDIEVILLDYSLAPDNQYPTQLNEALDLWNHLLQNGFKPDDIIIGGDSSGGNLGLALMQKLKKEYNNMKPKGAFFISAWTDMTSSGKSYYENYQKDIFLGEEDSPLTKEKGEIIKNSELYTFCKNADRTDPYVSPLFGDYDDFPDSLFIIGGDEMLRDDTLYLVEKIRNSNPKNNLKLFIFEGMFHTFPIYTDLIPEAREARQHINQFIIENFEEVEKQEKEKEKVEKEE